MSRNKDIAYLHDLTGWDFKTCRLIMKEFRWDLQTIERAYILSQDEGLRECIEKIIASVAEAVDKAFEALKPVIENAAEALGQLAENIRPVLDEAHQKMIEYQKPEVIEAAIDEDICRLNHCMPKADSEGINWEEME